MAVREKDPLARLSVLADSVDETFASIQTRQGACMQCSAGCTDCCRARPSITHVERAFFRRGLARLSEAERKELAQRTRDKAREMCPALDPEGRCQLYDSRPLICRSFSVPLRRRHEVVLVNPPVIDVCDLNFVDEPLETLAPEDVLEQTSLDAELAAINAEFCARHDLPTDERIGIGANPREPRLTPPGKPPPLAVRLEEALPFRRVIDDLLSMNREVQKRRSTCESGKANRT